MAYKAMNGGYRATFYLLVMAQYIHIWFIHMRMKHIKLFKGVGGSKIQLMTWNTKVDSNFIFKIKYFHLLTNIFNMFYDIGCHNNWGCSGQGGKKECDSQGINFGCENKQLIFYKLRR